MGRVASYTIEALQDTAKPISRVDGASVKVYLGKDKMLHEQ